jgi:hypothetical protein
MKAEEILDTIERAITEYESEAFDETVKARAEEGWANPTLQAQNEWQGHDNGVVFGTFADAVRDLTEYSIVPVGIPYYDEDDEDDPRDFLTQHLGSSGVIGTGAPLAYVGVGGYFTLIREGATVEQIEQAATDCLPAGDDE